MCFNVNFKPEIMTFGTALSLVTKVHRNIPVSNRLIGSCEEEPWETELKDAIHAIFGPLKPYLTIHQNQSNYTW